MTIQLPQPISDFLSAERLSDSDALGRSFAADAQVRDEGRTIRGVAAIKQWNLDARAKYQYTVTPLSVANDAGCVRIYARLQGTFPGSPINVDYTFTLAGDVITALEIS